MNELPNDLHLNPIGNSLWRAGAGAGKTFNLVRRVMRIAEDWSLKNDGRFPRLVVTTFTRMATQELRVRLMEAALKAASDGKSELIPFVTSRSQLFVTTLHGVMDSFLRSFGSEIGLEPAFRVGGAEEIESLVRRVGNKTLFPVLSSPLANSVDETFSSAVDELMGEFDFSTTLRLLQRVSRIRLEFEETDRPARPATQSDMITSMAGSLREFARPLDQLRDEIQLHSPDAKWTPFVDWIGDIADQLRAIPAEAVAIEDLRLENLLAGIESEPPIRNAGKIKIDFGAGADWKAPLKDFASSVTNLVSEVAALEKFESVNRALELVETRFSHALRHEKFQAGLIELEDLELLALEVIRKSPHAAASYAESWDHWLIDEYQDTSPRQVALIAALAKDRPQFVVGDPQQSIYLFRGARPNVFLDREEHATVEGHEKQELLSNRRSHPEVMGFVNLAVKTLGSDFQEMTSHRASEKNDGRRQTSAASPFGAATFLSLEAATETTTAGATAGKAKTLKIDELRRLEAAQVVKAIGGVLGAGASPAAIAVLSRSNKDLGIIARELAVRKVPFQVHTAGAYSDRLEIADLCALLSFLSNPHDDENLIHLARSAWFPIDEDILARGFRRTGSLWNAVEAACSDETQEIEVLQAGLLAVRERGIVQAFREMLMSCDFFSWCGVLDPSGRREANALKFLAKLAVAERQSGFVPRRFVDEVLGGSDRGSENESNDRDAIAAVKPDRVHLMTIHVSKGLEFDHVFLPFLADAGGKGRSTSEFILHEGKRVWSVGLSVDDDSGTSAGPLAREWNDVLLGWGIEEQKRLLYVALTRARESLFLSATGEPKENSFLHFLRLDRKSGDHDFYRTTSFVEDSNVAQASGVQDPILKNPWGYVERTHQQTTYAGVSVTRLLEMEDEAAIERQTEVADAASTAMKRKPSNEKSRSLAMAKAAARGTRLHRVFELAKPDPAQASGEKQDVMAREIARWFAEDEQAEAREALRWLLSLNEPNLGAVLTSGAVEWSFTYLRGLYAVDGQIDLWGRDADGRLWIIDYKTGSSFFREKALRQLKYYAEALAAGGIARVDEQVYLCALYPFSKEIFTEPMTLKEALARPTSS